MDNVTIYWGQYVNCVDQDLDKGNTGDDCPFGSFTLKTLTTPSDMPVLGLRGNIFYDAIENTQSDPELQLEIIRRASNFSWYAIELIKNTEAQ